MALSIPKRDKNRWLTTSCPLLPTADIKPQSSLLSAIIKYGQDRNMRLKQMTSEEQAFAFEHLDPHLMEVLHYTHPSLATG